MRIYFTEDDYMCTDFKGQDLTHPSPQTDGQDQGHMDRQHPGTIVSNNGSLCCQKVVPLRFYYGSLRFVTVLL